MEIDDYRDYEKACGALREALKYLVKAETRSANELAEHTQRRIDLIEKFLAAKDLASKNVEQMVEICESLLNERHLEVRMTLKFKPYFYLEKGCYSHGGHSGGFD